MKLKEKAKAVAMKKQEMRAKVNWEYFKEKYKRNSPHDHYCVSKSREHPDGCYLLMAGQGSHQKILTTFRNLHKIALFR